jgi:hypothetical protein
VNALSKDWFDPNDGTNVWSEFMQMKTSALELIPFVEKISPIVAAKLQGEGCEDLTSSFLVSCNRLLTQLLLYQRWKSLSRLLGLIAENLLIALTSIDGHQTSGLHLFSEVNF